MVSAADPLWPYSRFSGLEKIRMYGCKKDEPWRPCRKLNNEKLHNLYSSPNIIRVMKSSKMKCGINKREINTKFKETTRNTYMYIAISQDTILKWILKKLDARVWSPLKLKVLSSNFFIIM